MENEIRLTLIDGPKVEIVGKEPANYHVQFIDDDSQIVVYQKFDLQPDHWAMANPRYLVNWRIVVWENGKKVFEEKADYHRKRIFIEYASKALGDNVAWIPYVEEFRKKYDAEVFVKTFWNELLSPGYPKLKFIEEGMIENCYAKFLLGAFDNNYSRNKNLWRLIPLQQIASDILGLDFQEIKPNIFRSKKKRPIKEKYVAISEYSTFLAKHWLYPMGWQEIVDWLNEMGYKVMSVSKEKTGLKNVIKKNDRPIRETVHNIQYAEAFIGPSCGLTPIAWGLDVPVVMISGFTLPDREPGCIRIINRAVCHGCGNDATVVFDRGNWNMCPRSKNFECSRNITPEMVKEGILQALGKRPRDDKEKIMFFIPHCSTGGMPQYLLRSVQELQSAGHDVCIVEHQNISAHYIVQKSKLQSLSRFYTLDGDKGNDFKKLLQKENPDIIHVHEFPERWLHDQEILDELYKPGRKYRIVETSHNSTKIEKQFIPDAFIFVSPLHLEQYKGIAPAYLAEYPIEKKERPPREIALRKIGVDPNQKHILNVGLFASWKNQAEIFEVARRLPQYQFHFVGNQAINFKDYWGPLMENKPDNCVIWGERQDVDDFYSSMDLFYFPSTWECSPIVLKEALSWQMPVIMRNLPAYCGTYDTMPVHFIDDDIERTSKKIVELLPEVGIGLEKIYNEIQHGVENEPGY